MALKQTLNRPKTSPNSGPQSALKTEQTLQTPELEIPTALGLSRALADPNRLTPANILSLQRTYGNQAVMRWLDRSDPKPPQRVQRTLAQEVAKLKPPAAGQTQETRNALKTAIDKTLLAAQQIDTDTQALDATVKAIVKGVVGTTMLPRLSLQIQNALTDVLAASSKRHLTKNAAATKQAATAATVELKAKQQEGDTATQARKNGQAPQNGAKDTEYNELKAASLQDPARLKSSSDAAVGNIQERVAELAAEETAQSQEAQAFIALLSDQYLVNMLDNDKAMLGLQAQVLKASQTEVDATRQHFSTALTGLNRYLGYMQTSQKARIIENRDRITVLSNDLSVRAQSLAGQLKTLTEDFLNKDENAEKIEKSVGVGITKAAQDATSKINSRKNTDSRHELKTASTEKARKVISGAENFKVEDTQAGDGSKKDKTIGDIAKESVEATLSGPLNSRLSAVGTMVGGRVPHDGDKLKIDIMVKVPVDTSGIGKLGFHFLGDIKNDDKNLKARLELSFVGGGDIAGLVELLGEVGGYLDAASSVDNIPAATAGETMMSQLSYALYRQCRKSATIPNKFINWMWGMGGATRQQGESEFDAKFREAEAWAKAMEKKFLESKDKKDKVEMGVFAALTAEAKSFTASLGSAKGQFKYLTGTKYNASSIEKGHKEDAATLSNDRGNRFNRFLKTPKGAMGLMGMQGSFGKETDRFELAAAIKAGPFGGELKAKFLKEGGLLKGDLTEVEVEGAATMMTGGVSAFADPTALGVKITNTIVQYGTEISHLVQMGRGKKKDMSATDDLAVASTDLGTTLSAMAGTYSTTMIDKLRVDKLIVEGGKDKALKGAIGNHALGMSGLKLAVKYSWKKANNAEGKLSHKIEFSLDYVSSLSAAGGGVFKGSYDKSRRILKLPPIEIGSAQAKDDTKGIKGFDGGFTKTGKNFKDPAQWTVGADTIKNYK